MNRELIGACGLYCGGCKNYDKEQKVCGGCGSQKLTEWCAKCEIRLCVKEKEYTSCIECKDYSCKKHKDFFDGGKLWEGARHRNDIMKNLKYLKESESEN